MNCALIFAGGTGQRMNSKTKPKQFLELHGKPIIAYTVEVFDSHPAIDAIVIVCLEAWIPFLKRKIDHYGFDKVIDVVPGGATGQESIRKGVDRLWVSCPEGSKVLVHDGVRPLVDESTITSCINSVERYGSAITVVPAIETIVREEDDSIVDIIDRRSCMMAKAPQAFRLKDLKFAHDRAQEDHLDEFIDSASLMRHYGYALHAVEGAPENIKITTPSDFYVFRAFVDARENSQIFGL